MDDRESLIKDLNGEYENFFGVLMTLGDRDKTGVFTGAFAVNPALFLPLHKALGEARFWAIMPLIALPGVLVLLRLDRTADRPERLRGRTKAPPPSPDLLPAITPEG